MTGFPPPHVAVKAVGMAPTFPSIWNPAARSSSLRSSALRLSL